MDDFYHCPVCGHIPWTSVYIDKYSDVVGCDNCVKVKNPEDMLEEDEENRWLLDYDLEYDSRKEEQLLKDEKI